MNRRVNSKAKVADGANLPEQGTTAAGGSPEREIELLKRRRAEDQARLAELTKTRDLLEARSAIQLAKMAELRDKLSERERIVEQLDRRVGGARLLGKGEPEPDKPDSTGWKGIGRFITSKWWRMQTLREARRAHRRGKLVEAQILFDAVLLGGETADLWVELAHVLREREMFEAAEWAYRRALELNPGSGEALFLRGFCFEKNGEKAKAARLYEQALESDPKLIEKYDHLRDYHARLFA